MALGQFRGKIHLLTISFHFVLFSVSLRLDLGLVMGWPGLEWNGTVWYGGGMGSFLYGGCWLLARRLITGCLWFGSRGAVFVCPGCCM